jgi:hypothetical protein
MTAENKEISVEICAVGSRIEPGTLMLGGTTSRFTRLGNEWEFLYYDFLKSRPTPQFDIEMISFPYRIRLCMVMDC